MTTSPPSDSGRPPIDDLSAIHPYRRYLLYTLVLGSPPLALADIAHQITVWETGAAAERHRQQRLEIYMALYHDHLPPLRDVGVVAYSQADDAVRWRPDGPQAEPAVRRQLQADIADLLAAEADACEASE